MPLCPRTTVTGARRLPKCQKCNLLAKALQLHVNLNSTRRVKQGPHRCAWICTWTKRTCRSKSCKKIASRRGLPALGYRLRWSSTDHRHIRHMHTRLISRPQPWHRDTTSPLRDTANRAISVLSQRRCTGFLVDRWCLKRPALVVRAGAQRFKRRVANVAGQGGRSRLRRRLVVEVLARAVLGEDGRIVDVALNGAPSITKPIIQA